MGARGPAPAPTAIAIARGTRPSRINLDEPRPKLLADGRIVVPPVDLSPVALEVWDRVAPALVGMRTLSAADLDGLAVYCEAVARWRRLAPIAAKASPTIKGRDDRGRVRNPIFAQIREAENAVRVWARELGLTPAARAGIRVTTPPGDDAERLLTAG